MSADASARIELVLGAVSPGPWPNDATLVRDALLAYGAVLHSMGMPGTDVVGINRNTRTADRALELANAIDERLEVIREDQAERVKKQQRRKA